MATANVTTMLMPKGFDRPEFTTLDLGADAFHERIDPFIVISMFEMRAPVFPPHPHAGFSVATYIFPESEVGFWNQDTLGERRSIPPGSLHLIIAGSGVLHEETVARSGRSARGLQIWIDHAASDREVEPRSLHLAQADMPVVTQNGVTLCVLFGQSGGARSPIELPVSACILDVELAEGAVFQDHVRGGETGFAIVRSGLVETGNGSAQAGWVTFMDEGEFAITARETSRLTFFGGRALRHRVVQAGSFIASSEAQAHAFRTRFTAGEMGRLTPFDQAGLDQIFDASLKAEETDA